MPGFEIRLAELEGDARAPDPQEKEGVKTPDPKGELWAYINERLPDAHQASKGGTSSPRTVDAVGGQGVASGQQGVAGQKAPELSTFHLYRLMIEFLQEDEGRSQKMGVSPLTAKLQDFKNHELRFEMSGTAKVFLRTLEDFFNQINENILGARFLRFQVREQTAGEASAGDVLMNVEPCPLLVYEARESGFPKKTNKTPYGRAPKWEFFVEDNSVVLGYYFNPPKAFLALDHDGSEWIRFFEGSFRKKKEVVSKKGLRKILRGAGWNKKMPIGLDGFPVHPSGPAHENLLYQALYLIEGKSIGSHLIQFEPTGMGFGGAGRADRVDAGEFHYRVLRQAEGKPENPWLTILEDKIPKNEWADFRNPSDFAQCNTPGGVASEHGKPPWLPFEIHYFRKLTAVGGETRIEKSCTKTPLEPSDTSPHLPIRAVPNAQSILQDLQEGTGSAGRPRQTMEVKGASMGRSRGPRVDAKGVMAFVAGNRSATQFLDQVLMDSSTARSELGKLKGAGALSFTPIKQEWCHLLGHGDGGVEWVGNFVCGSYHCNTEQLAIESAIRHFSHEHPWRFTLNSTAYLLPNDSFPENWFDAYLQEHRPPPGNLHSGTRVEKAAPVAALIRYRILAAGHGVPSPVGGAAAVQEPPSEKRSPKSQDEASDPTQTTSGPEVTPVVGDQGTTGGRIVVFDHLFEGQSEFFDIHQYRIVYYTVMASVSRYALETYGTEEEKARFKVLKEGKDLVTLINKVLREGPRRLAEPDSDTEDEGNGSSGQGLSKRNRRQTNP